MARRPLDSVSAVGLDERSGPVEVIEREFEADFVEVAQSAAPADSPNSDRPTGAVDAATAAAEVAQADVVEAEPEGTAPTAAEAAPMETAPVEAATVDAAPDAAIIAPAPEDANAEPPTSAGVDRLPMVIAPSFSKFVPQSGVNAAFDLNYCGNAQLQAQFRALRRSVIDALANARAEGRSPLVVVTSSVPGDGKSFISFHLANSLTSEPDLETVLVDGDLSRQQMSRLFASDDPKGMADGLRQRESLHRLIHRTDIANLKLMRAGARSLEAVEFLGGPRWLDMVQIMRSCGPRYLFLIDAPPVLATSEAQYLARSADLVLFVVRSESTAQSAVTQALARLGSNKNLAFVFNGRVSTEANYYFGYSYYESFDVLPKKK